VSADLLGLPDGPGEQRLSPVWRVREYSAVPIGSRRQASHPVENSCVLIMNGAWMASLPARAHAAGLPAVWLRDQDAAAFGMLAATPVTFSYRDAGTELSATRPLISLDPRGRVREIRCNGRSLQPPRLVREIRCNGRSLQPPRLGPTCYADLDGVESAMAVAGREREKGKDRS
jgi:hypothetical protein